MMPPISVAPTRRGVIAGAGAVFAWSQLPRPARADGHDPRFVAIVLRGALDGLAVIAPIGDPHWRDLRGADALTLDGESPGLRLDGLFALNPACWEAQALTPAMAGSSASHMLSNRHWLPAST